MPDITPATVRMLGGKPVVRVHSRSDYLNMLIYGDSGIGKTRLAGSASEVPEMSPVVVLDIEGGTESLRTPYPDVEIVRVDSWKVLLDVYEELKLGNTGFQTCAIDSVTEGQKYNMQSVMEQAVIDRPDKADPDAPDIRAWGVSGSQLRRMIRNFRDLPMNTIFTALPSFIEDKQTMKKEWYPSLPGKLAAEVPGYLDIVGYYYVKEVKELNEEGEEVLAAHRYLLTQKTTRYAAKDRTGTLPAVMTDPTMKQIREAIQTGRLKNNGA